MKTWFIFEVTNYLGFTKRVSIWANSTEEGKEKLDKYLEYPAKEIKYVGNRCYNSSKDLGEINCGGMSAVDKMIALNMFFY